MNLGVIIMKEKKMEYFIVVSKNGITYLGLWWDFDDVGLVGVEVFMGFNIIKKLSLISLLGKQLWEANVLCVFIIKFYTASHKIT